MNTTLHVAFGIALGLLIAALIMLRTLMSYVQSDLDGFRRWLDKREAS